MASVIRGNDNFDSSTSIVYDKLSSGSFAGAGSVEITLSGSYNVYEILLRGVRHASTNVLYYARFKSGSTTYTSGYKTNDNLNQTLCYLGTSDGNAENVGICGTYTIFEPHNSSHYTHTTFMGGQADNDRWQQTSNRDYGGMLENTADMTAILIDANNSANFTHGNWTLYGVNI